MMLSQLQSLDRQTDTDRQTDRQTDGQRATLHHPDRSVDLVYNKPARPWLDSTRPCH